MNVEIAMLAAQAAGDGGGFGSLLVPLVISLAVMIFYIAAGWRFFDKAGQPGWGCLIPIYNAYLVLKIAGRPGWWLILLIIPLVQIIVAIIVWIDVARNFGKGTGFGLGLMFLWFIFVPILAFGDARYQGAHAG